MDIHPDFKELLALLNAHKVEYAIVGSYALAHYGAPRFTGDIDILVQPSSENSIRVLSALKDFGLESLDFGIEDFGIRDNIVHLGVAPIRADIITSISGVSWEEVKAHRVIGMFGDIEVFYIGIEQFIENKRASGRAKDLADIEAIGSIKKK